MSSSNVIAKPDPDIPPNQPPSQTPTIPSSNRPYTRLSATGFGYFLLLTGTCSDMVQKFYGASPTLGITDLVDSLREAKSASDIASLAFLFAASASAGVQSYYLEKEFTLNFAKKRFGLLKDNDKLVAHGTKAKILKKADAELFKSSLSLNKIEKVALGLITLLGASVRDFTTIMGFDTVNAVMVAPKKGLAGTLTAASVDFAQAVATDGEFLQKLYLIYRLWIASTLNPNDYEPDFVKAMYNYLHNGDEDDDLHHCRSWQGYAVSFFVANVLGGLAVSSDVGIAKLALDEFGKLILIDEQYIALQWLWTLYKYGSLTSLFLLMYSIDARSLANEVTSRFEDYFFPEPEDTRLSDLAKELAAADSTSQDNGDIKTDNSSSSGNSTPEVTTHSTAFSQRAKVSVAAAICLLGAILTAINGYSGNQYLFGQDGDDDNHTDSTTVQAIMYMSLLIAAIKFGQSLSVEGVYAYKGIMKSSWSCPCTSADGAGSIGKPYLQVSSHDDIQTALLGADQFNV